MNRKIFYIFIGALILIIAFLFRFYKLSTVLSGFPIDDSGLGYSAYSILKTGKDEFGKSFPILLRSQGDFRTPVYAYSIIPFIKIFGLSMFSVRLPSAIFGFLTIPALFLLTLELTGKKPLALLSALLLSISPWHIIFSRNAFDSNLALFFMILGFYFLFKSFKKPKMMLFSALSLGISILSYRVEQIIIPIILLIVFIKFKKELFEEKRRKYLLLSIVLLILISFPLIMLLNTPAYWVRANVLGIFAPVVHLQNISFTNLFLAASSFINNAGYDSLRLIFETYFIYFSPRFINALGDYLNSPTYLELPSVFMWQIPFYVWGIISLIKNKDLKNLKFFTFAMLLVFPIPAALVRDPLSPMRALQMIIPQSILISFGLLDLFVRLKNKLYKSFACLIFAALIIYSIINSYTSIFILGNSYMQNLREWGWDKISYDIENLHTDFPIIVNDPSGGYSLELAFFLKYDPSKYQKENFVVPTNEYYFNLFRKPEKHLGNITTRLIDLETDTFKKEYLVADTLILTDQVIESNKFTLVSEIRYPDGRPAFRIVKTSLLK